MENFERSHGIKRGETLNPNLLDIFSKSYQINETKDKLLIKLENLRKEYEEVSEERKKFIDQTREEILNEGKDPTFNNHYASFPKKTYFEKELDRINKQIGETNKFLKHLEKLDAKERSKIINSGYSDKEYSIKAQIQDLVTEGKINLDSTWLLPIQNREGFFFDILFEGEDEIETFLLTEGESFVLGLNNCSLNSPLGEKLKTLEVGFSSSYQTPNGNIINFKLIDIRQKV